MRLSEYDDESLLEEVKHRGFEIKVKSRDNPITREPLKIIIGGIEFELIT